MSVCGCTDFLECLLLTDISKSARTKKILQELLLRAFFISISGYVSFNAIILGIAGIYGTNTVQFHLNFHLKCHVYTNYNCHSPEPGQGNTHEMSGKLIQCYINYCSM